MPTNYIKSSFILSIVGLSLIACNTNNSKTVENTEAEPTDVQSTWSVTLEELFDEAYPNNPDISIRHAEYTQVEYDAINLEKREKGHFNLTVTPFDNKDTISLIDIDLMELMPTICNKIEDNEYLSYIGIVNQEWNRHQVKFLEGEFEVSGENSAKIKRVDLARNCLNAYLWEVIFYAEEDDALKPYYHGWFDFPHQLYADLFEERNQVPFTQYQAPLEEWIDPENKKIELDKLRKVQDEKNNCSFASFNSDAYPLAGERKKKQMNIMHPLNTVIMQDFLTDSTVFATFSPPGFYNQEDPRSTELGRMANLSSASVRILENDLFEIELNFGVDSDRPTNFIVSGLEKNEIPRLKSEDVNSAWQNSMGFGNHTFYETYSDALKKSSLTSEYFAILTDGEYNWLDSHDIGIDGPMLHWDIENPKLLHFWILSFERHALISHYSIDCSIAFI